MTDEFSKLVKNVKAPPVKFPSMQPDIKSVKDAAFLEGRRYQQQEILKLLIRRATTIPAENKPHNYAHEGRVVVIPEEDWQAFNDMETG